MVKHLNTKDMNKEQPCRPEWYLTIQRKCPPLYLSLLPWLLVGWLAVEVLAIASLQALLWTFWLLQWKLQDFGHPLLKALPGQMTMVHVAWKGKFRFHLFCLCTLW